jgi:hypothetical protein
MTLWREFVVPALQGAFGALSRAVQSSWEGKVNVKELIAKLEKCNPEARVFHAYDSDIVVEESGDVITLTVESIVDSWWGVKPRRCGDISGLALERTPAVPKNGGGHARANTL